MVKKQNKTQHLVVFAWFVLSLQNWIDQIKFWKVTGNSTVSYVALNTVQSSEGAQLDTGPVGGR